MSDRIDFPPKVRDILRDRAANRCSFPGCRSITTGPSEESDSSVSRTGMACHIIPASPGPGARRAVKGISDSYLMSIDNGIWMCYTHGKLIDTDETRFTVEMLKSWRKIAELSAQISQQTGRDVWFGADRLAPVPLPKETISLRALGSENRLIDEAIESCCVKEVWGSPFAYDLKMLLIELARNSVLHGGAKNWSFDIGIDRVKVVDDGLKFSPLEFLPQTNGGGSKALRRMLGRHGSSAIIEYHYADQANNFLIGLPKSLADVHTITPCSLIISREDIVGGNVSLVLLEDCNRVYVTFTDFVCISDVALFKMIVDPLVRSGKDIIFVIDADADSLRSEILIFFPDADFLIVKGA